SGDPLWGSPATPPLGAPLKPRPLGGVFYFLLLYFLNPAVAIANCFETFQMSFYPVRGAIQYKG
ncbi:MAG: hypothetical protein JXQ81_07230, partial [Desulfuromonadales bacterium]|nr:hypothetical protein [Desulfuromonadales bacterium]MBN2792278.1 hypothetical protein [Desulfuromonadales bacterium]